MSVAEITTSVMYEGGGSKEGGLLDLRLGTTNRGDRCLTCGGNRESCPGHFGHIELARPMYHIGFLPITLRVLRCVCYHCSALLCADRNSDAFKAALKIDNHR